MMFRTPTQQKACQNCSIAKTADLVGDSATLLIVRDLSRGDKSFGELTASLPNISSRTLTKKLKNLENEEVITRKEVTSFPPRVFYSLTKKGKGLKSIIKELDNYGKKYL